MNICLIGTIEYLWWKHATPLGSLVHPDMPAYRHVTPLGSFLKYIKKI